MKKFYVAQAIHEDGSSECRTFSYYGKTFSKWANKKYLEDNNVTVKIYDCDDLDKPICTYHA